MKRILSSVLAFFGGAKAYNKSRFVLTGCKSAVNFFLLCFLFLHLRVKLETKKVLELQEKCFGVQGGAPRWEMGREKESPKQWKGWAQIRNEKRVGSGGDWATERKRVLKSKEENWKDGWCTVGDSEIVKKHDSEGLN